MYHGTEPLFVQAICAEFDMIAPDGVVVAAENAHASPWCVYPAPDSSWPFTAAVGADTISHRFSPPTVAT